MAKVADIYFAVDPWKIIEDGFDPAYSRVSESVFSLGNETQGVRGCFDEGGSVDSLRGAYTNGVFDMEQFSRSYKGIIDKTHFMVPSAEWLMTEIVLDNEKLDLGKVRFEDFTRVLDMRAGTLTRSFVWTTESGKQLKLTFLRFMDMVHRERAYQRVTMEALNFDGEVAFTTGLSFDAVHEGYRKCFWQNARVEAESSRMLLKARTTASNQEEFAGALVSLPGEVAISKNEKTAALRCNVPLTCGQPVRLDKRVVVVFDGTEGDALWQNGLAALDACAAVSLDEAMEAQRTYWEAYWQTSDIDIIPAGDDTAELVAA